MDATRIFCGIVVVGLGGWVLTLATRGLLSNLLLLAVIIYALYLVLGFINGLCGKPRQHDKQPTPPRRQQ